MTLFPYSIYRLRYSITLFINSIFLLYIQTSLLCLLTLYPYSISLFNYSIYLNYYSTYSRERRGRRPYLGLLQRGRGWAYFPPALAEGGWARPPILRLRGRLSGVGPGGAELVGVGRGREGGRGGRHVCSVVLCVEWVAWGRRGRALPPRPAWAGRWGRSAVLVGGCKLKWVCICVVSIKGVYKCFKCKRCA